jgi:hypothetical protein
MGQSEAMTMQNARNQDQMRGIRVCVEGEGQNLRGYCF